MKRKYFKRSLCYVLILALLISSIPAGVFAASPSAAGEQVPRQLTEEEILASYPGAEADPGEARIVKELPEKRTANTKHFLTENQSFVAMVYEDSVHYQDGEEWKEIDNTLRLKTQEGGNVYENTDSDVSVQIAETADSSRLVAVEKGGYQISWGLAPAAGPMLRSAAPAFGAPAFELYAQEAGENSAAPMLLGMDEAASEEENASEQPEDILQYNSEQAAVQHVNSGGVYRDILPDIDMEYYLKSETVKENIILKSRNAAGTALSFRISHEGLTAAMNEDGSVALVSPGTPEEEVYRFSVPFMTDANGEVSRLVAYRLEAGEGQSTLSIVPDASWLNAEGRAYPVIIDPVTETSKKSTDITDTFITSGAPNDAAVANYGSFVIGHTYEEGICRAFVKFNNLPELNPGDLVYKGYFSIWQYMFDAEGAQSLVLTAHRPGNWARSVTWNTQPGYDSTILDQVTIGPVYNASTNTITYTEKAFDITSQVREWYNTGVNNGIMIKSDEESRHAMGRFFTSDYPFNTPGNREGSSDQFPSGIFYYKNASGLESCWSYHEQSAGRAGTGYTNDFNGNLVYIHDDAATSGGLLPVSVSHVYNFTESGKITKFGAGWQLNVTEQFASTGIANYPYVYIDSDGTRHYFYKDGSVYRDEDGLDLKVTVNPNIELRYTMETKDGVVLKFDDAGYIRRYIDTVGNEIWYNYGIESGARYLFNIKDGAGHMLYFTYDYSTQLLRSIKDQAGRFTQYTYDANKNLTRIDYPDGKSTAFQYESGHRLKQVTSPDGYALCYEYTQDMRVPRVSRITEKNGSETGQVMNISYRNGNTTIFESCGMDGDIGTKADNLVTTCRFDNFGRPTEVHDDDGNANTYKFYNDGKQNNKLNITGSMQQISCSPVCNPGFDEGFADIWWHDGFADSLAYSVNRRSNIGYIGNTSIEVSKPNECVPVGVTQSLTLDAGAYTLSAYVKPGAITGEGGACLLVTGRQVDQAYTALASSEKISSTEEEINGGWVRLSATFEVEQNASYVQIWGAIADATGNAWFDCFQLDKGTVAQKFNLIDNGSFERGTQQWVQNSTDGSVAANAWDGSHAGRITGSVSERRSFLQGINVSGSKEGDVFTVSGWAKANTLPGREFSIAAAVLYNDGSTPKWTTAKTSPYISDWQFCSAVIETDDGDSTTNKSIYAIHVYLFYGSNRNTAYFDGIQVTREDASTYVYDEEGNFVSASSAADAARFTYDKNDNLTKMTDITGASFEYRYNGNKTLKSATNSQGVKYRFTYDDKGNPVSSAAQKDGTSLSLTIGGRYRIRNKLSGHYMKADSSGNVLHGLFSLWGDCSDVWKLESASGGYYTLVNEERGEALEVENGSNTVGANVITGAKTPADKQRLLIKPMDDGSYQIFAKCSNDTKLVSVSSTGVNQNVSLQAAGEDNSKKWYFHAADTLPIYGTAIAGDNYVYKLRFAYSGQYFTEMYGNEIRQDYLNDEETQQFRLEKVEGESGAYYLHPMSQPEKVLEFGEADSENGGNLPVTIAEKTGADNQKFVFAIKDSANYTIMGKGTGRYLRVYSTPNTQYAMVMLMAPVTNQTDRIELEDCSDTIRSSMTYTADKSQVASITDSRGNVTANTYDAAGRLLAAVTDAAGRTVSYTYDADTDALAGVSQQTANGTASVGYTYTDDRLTSIAHNGFQYGFTYDAFGNKLQTTAAGQALSSNTYLPHNGQLSESSYGTGQKVGFTYDKYGRTIAKSYNGTEAFRNEYDSGGNLLRHLDLQNNVTYRYEYDLIGRLTGMRSSKGQELQVHYDDKNRVDYSLSRVNGKLVKTEYGYTNLEATGYNMLRSGQMAQIKVNNTLASEYFYDELGRVTQTKLRPGGTNQSYDTEYGYLPGAGPKDTTTLVNHVKQGNVSCDYTYDAAGNILTVTENGELKLSCQYDELNQLVREDNSYLGVTKTYTYDLAGNLLQKKEYTGAQHGEETLGAPAETIVYSYPSTGWKDQLVSYNGQSITYDQIGNPLSYWNGMEFTWSNGRQLTGIANGSHTVSYQYDSNSMRTKKTVDGVTTEYFLNGSTLLSQVTGDTQLDFFYDDLGNAMGFIKNGTDKYYYIRNLQNDIVGILDSSGTQVVEYAYDTWGKLESVTGAMAETIGRENPLRYRGYYYDEETGFYYLQSRYYDPETGRFLNADETVLTGQGITSGNMYAYCGNNPVNRADPSGQFWITALIVTAVVALCTLGLSGCSSKPAPTSNVGAAQPYVNMPGSSDKNSPNCYAYAIGSPVNEQPGVRSGKTPSKWNDVNAVGKSVEADLKSMGKTVRRIDGPDAKVYENEFKIALRVGTQPYAYNQFSGELYYDYHFMRQTDTGQWAEKHGIGGASVLWDAGMTPDTIPWTLNDMPYYDSPIVYYAIGN